MLVDERGAIWPSDAYVGLELHRYPTARITLKIKPVAVTVEEEIEMYDRGDEEEDESDEEVRTSAAASSARGPGFFLCCRASRG